MLNRWELGILLVAPLVIGGLLLGAWHVSPALRERSLEIVLAFGPYPVKKYAAGALRDYPTRNAALALVAFLNLNNPGAPAPPHDTGGEALSEEARRALEAEAKARFEKRREIGEEALISLCELSGQSFGTLYSRAENGYSWGSLSRTMWPSVLAEVDAWALGTFGPSFLAAWPFGEMAAAGAAPGIAPEVGR
jgi:hypothetical protein